MDPEFYNAALRFCEAWVAFEAINEVSKANENRVWEEGLRLAREGWERQAQATLDATDDLIERWKELHEQH